MMENDRIVCGATPLPASPTRGEVPFRDFGMIVAAGTLFTSPLVGEAGRGGPRAVYPEAASC
jgi:hypothetical protein